MKSIAGYKFLPFVIALSTLMAYSGTVTQNGVVYTTYSDYAVISQVTYDCPSHLIIPSQINGLKVTEVAREAFDDVYLDELVLPDSITILRSSAFYGRISKLTLGNGLKTIERVAFDYLQGLKSLTIPDSVTSIGYKAFDMDDLESISLPCKCSLPDPLVFSTHCPLKSIYIRGGKPDYTINLDSFISKPTVYLEVSGISELWGCPVEYNNPRAVTGISINGNGTIPYGGNATFTCTATLRNGTTELVTPIWELANTAFANVTTAGKVTNKNTSYLSQQVSLNASYIQDGIAKTNSVTLTLEGKPNELTALEISGETNVVPGVEYRYEARGTYADSTSKIVPGTWSIITGGQFASISTDGVLNIASLPVEMTIGIQADYIEKGISKSASLTVQAKPAVFPESVFEYTYILNPGWQMISIVLNLDDNSKTSLLALHPFIFDNNMYVQANDLAAGMSCWIFVPEKTTIRVSGTPCGVLKTRK